MTGGASLGMETSLTPATYNIAIYQGDDDAFVLTYSTGGTIADLTGFTAKMDVRTNRSATSTVATFSSAAGTISIDAPNGKITVPLSHAVTGALAPADYVYDLQIISASGAVTTIVAGLFTVVQEVTHV